MTHRKLIWIVLAFSAMSLSGCRLGNHVDTKANESNPSGSSDGISGFYEMTPQTVTLCAQFSASNSCVSVPTNQIPAEPFFNVARKLSNPIALVLQDAGQAILWNYNLGNPSASAKNYFLVDYTQQADVGKINLTQGTNVVAVWDDANCVTQAVLQLDGESTRTASHDVGSIPVWGKIALDALQTQEFGEAVTGACATSLTKLVNCYRDLNQCSDTLGSAPADNQAWANTVLGSYIHAGVISDVTVPDVSLLSFQVSYH